MLLSAPQQAIRYGDFVAAARALSGLLVAKNVTLTASLQRNTANFLETEQAVVKRFAELYEDGMRATRAYVDEVKRGVFPTEEHSFGARTAAPATDPVPGTYGPH